MNERMSDEIREPNVDEDTGVVLTPAEVEGIKAAKENEGWREQK